MGFFGDMWDSCFSVGKFTKEGVLFIPDNVVIPWTKFKHIEISEDYVFEMFGGITLYVGGSNFNDQLFPDIDNETAVRYFEEAQASKKYQKLLTIEELHSEPSARKMSNYKKIWDMIDAGQDLLNMLENTTNNGNVTVSYYVQSWEYLSLIVQLYFEIIETLNANKARLFEKEWKERLVECISKHLEMNVFDDIEQVEDENKQRAGCFCEALVRLGATDEKAYDYLRLSSIFGCRGELVKARVKSCLARKNNEIGQSAFEKSRRVIVCTREIGRVANESEVEMDALIATAEDLETYNSLVSPNLRIRFMSTHPRNGCTYIQYPFDKNLYFEVNEFHDMVRERKQNELLRLLESLGAYSAKVEVRHTMQVRDNYNASCQTNGNGSGICGAEIQGSLITGEEIQKTSLSAQALAKEYSFNPPDEVAIPDDLVFFPQEESWQNIAKSVLRGGMKHASVDLEYKTEYGINEKFLSELSASFKALIPSYEMNLKQEFSIGLEKLTTTQWHYDVSFENEKGKRASKGKIKILPCESDGLPNKAEGLFLKRARRYAQSDRRMDEEQREDLETFAKKYGIDGFRMEELIEEAFE